MSPESGPFLPSGYVPRANRLVFTSRSDDAGIWAEGQAEDIVCMSLESGPFLAGGYVPQPNRVAAFAYRSQGFTTWADPATVPQESGGLRVDDIPRSEGKA